jgi:hypothetical protein
MNKTILLLSLFLLVALQSYSQDVRTVVADGVATIGSDPAAARDKAIEDAMRRAVEQAVGTIVESETTVQNYELLSDKIYSQSSGYVKSYKILSERAEGNLLRVQISADVDSGNLNNDLSAIGLLQRRMKYPRVMVMIAEENVMQSDYWEVYSLSNSQSEATFITRLKAKGFNVVNPSELRQKGNSGDAMAAWEGNSDAAGRMGSRLGAEVVIVGQAISNRAANNIAGSDLLSMSTSLTVRAVKAGTGEIIAQGSGQGTAAHINEVAALQKSMQKASDNAADQIIAGILESWQRESTGTRTLVVVLFDLSSEEAQDVKAGLEKIRGVTEVLIRDYTDGSAELNVQSRTNAPELAASIAKTKFPGIRLALLSSSADRLEYRVVR